MLFLHLVIAHSKVPLRSAILYRYLRVASETLLCNILRPFYPLFCALTFFFVEKRSIIPNDSCASSGMVRTKWYPSTKTESYAPTYVPKIPLSFIVSTMESIINRLTVLDSQLAAPVKPARGMTPPALNSEVHVVCLIYLISSVPKNCAVVERMCLLIM